MDRDRTVISEAKLSSLIALTCVPIFLIIIMSIGLVGGFVEDKGMYFRSFGPVVYVIFYGGLLYSTYEFLRTISNRKNYISVIGGRVCILYHRPIDLVDISNVYLETGIVS